MGLYPRVIGGISGMMESLHWLRPLWLLALLPLIAAWWWVLRRGVGSSAWESYVDPALQPYVLAPASKRSHLGVHALFFTWFLALIVLAGPVWEQQPVPVYEARPSMVVVMDISPSMDLDDLAPSRIERAVFKLSDLLDQARGIDIGLLVFAERPYVVSPLTDDVKTLQAFLPSVSTALAPVRGSQLNLAIDRAVELLQQAGKADGQIVLFTDSEIRDQDVTAASAANDAGYALSVIGVGTRNGAPLRDENGNFIRNENGAVVVPKLNMSELRKLANAAGGVSTAITANTSDINAVIELSASQIKDQTGSTLDGAQDNRVSDYWVEHTVWVLPLFLLMGLGLFRKGLAL